jgi:hypothetical protein
MDKESVKSLNCCYILSDLIWNDFVFVYRAKFEELSASLFKRVENVFQALLDNSSEYINIIYS